MERFNHFAEVLSSWGILIFSSLFLISLEAFLFKLKKAKQYDLAFSDWKDDLAPGATSLAGLIFFLVTGRYHDLWVILGFSIWSFGALGVLKFIAVKHLGNRQLISRDNWALIWMSSNMMSIIGGMCFLTLNNQGNNIIWLLPAMLLLMAALWLVFTVFFLILAGISALKTWFNFQSKEILAIKEQKLKHNSLHGYDLMSDEYLAKLHNQFKEALEPLPNSWCALHYCRNKECGSCKFAEAKAYTRNYVRGCEFLKSNLSDLEEEMKKRNLPLE